MVDWRIVDLLKKNNYDLIIQQQSMLKDTSLFTIYAIQQGQGRKTVAQNEHASLPTHESSWHNPSHTDCRSAQFSPATIACLYGPFDVCSFGGIAIDAKWQVDRRALPVPEQEKLEKGKAIVAPRTALEEDLALIWAHVLHREQVSVYDNFFDLGGHSLNATQVISRVRQTLNMSIPLLSLFEHPTLAGFAQVVEQKLEESKEEHAFLADISTAHTVGEAPITRAPES